VSVVPLSLAHLSFIELDPLALIELAGGAGFDAVGLRINAPSHSPMPWKVVGDPAMVRAIRQRCAAAGVTVQDAEAFALGADTDVDAYRAGIATAAELGARFVLTAGADPEPARLLDSFGRFCDLAAAEGLRVAVEFLPYRPLRTLQQAVELVDQASRPNAGVLVDVLHLARSGGAAADLAAIDPARIVLLHLCDAAAAAPADGDLPREARHHRFPPGEGGLPPRAVLAALPPGLPVGVEAPCARDAALPLPERARRLSTAARRLLAANIAA